MSNFTISVIYGSVRPHRVGVKGAQYLCRELQQRNHRVHFIDPVKYTLPLLEKMYKEFQPQQAPEAMKTLAGLLEESDGFLVVTGEYNHSIPPALKNLLDHFQSEYFYKPSAIASYSVGSFGGVRATVHLRAILGELGAPSIPRTIPMPNIQSLFDDADQPTDKAFAKRSQGFLNEFEWYLEAFKRQRERNSSVVV